MFPFVLPWDDSTPGTATDVSSLNAKPAGRPRVHCREERPLRRVADGQCGYALLATNFAAKAAFPDHADAEKVAARVAKLGINIVRLHHMDNPGWGPGSNIWDPRTKTTSTSTRRSWTGSTI